MWCLILVRFNFYSVMILVSSRFWVSSVNRWWLVWLICWLVGLVF